MKKILLLFLSILASGFTTHLCAQEFSLDADLRARYEHRRGSFTLRPVNDAQDVAANFVTQRTRIITSFADKSSKLSFKLSLQDIRTWGATPQLGIGDNNNLGMYEGWGTIHFDTANFIRIGRQELSYDDNRFLGNVDWAMQGRSHDAILYQHKGDYELQIGAAIHNNRETQFREQYTVNNYKAMQFARFNKKLDALDLTLLFFNNGQEYIDNNNPTREDLETIYSQTYGARAKFDLDIIKFDINFYYQGGKDATDVKIRAFDLSPVITLGLDNGVSIVAGFEWLSGSDINFDTPGTPIRIESKNKSFSPFYGTNHKFNGLMDYFYVGNHFNNVGLQDYFGGFNVKADDLKFYGMIHIFNTWGNMIQNNEEIDKYLGAEVDLTAMYSLNEFINIQGGVSAMFADENMEVLKGGDADKFNYWAWAMVVIKPNLFKASGWKKNNSAN
ncbi:hypothetical protein V6R21_15430 [Limibacter armeniacum]|uniref:hypothetical protein n=1 Tax=Limibacter armeniacum TaxID=466084 RepID=UPI002FE602B4